MRPGSSRAPRERGFTFLAVLAAMFLLALASQKVMSVVSQQAQREREEELIRVGRAFRAAIGSYYLATPGSVKRYPKSLDELVEDRRFVGIRRHLRKVYEDPVSRDKDWGLVLAADGGIAGVHSKSSLEPLRSAAMDLGDFRLPSASQYAQWLFVYQPPASASGARDRSRP